ncbi:pyridoxamine 5'-phosphate oxidase family protein [Halanaeroarchaeum sulfurireducens]|uniref:FMN-binding domain protein n=1 Tax=Halanaeroarchaeum sulfurireducens TaxID=1604004 RepID=A0A0F7PCC2_9EURY|nr:pyridoxamine 5'-phosphate oxidase family protein [Halanaeroarchaeum sulfurireducens]AKH98362.1 FMN-binding domain protein [Halanaeroarchaeum sulfurireducens]ALG82756.1 FMN-binding domain protein [Halanaeroarchaeum sulfurireducens]
MTGAPNREDAPAGPTLYLESDRLDSSICTRVFDGDEGPYRVVQVTSTHAFDSLQAAMNDHLEQAADPSEAAVIMLTPQSERDTELSEVGRETTLYGFRVSPEDLTGISIAFSKLLQRWERTDEDVRICLRGIESLLPYHDAELLYRFLNTILATLQGAGARVHMHLRDGTTDDRTLSSFQSLFSQTVEPGDSPLEPESSAAAEVDHEEPGDAPAGELTDEFADTTTDVSAGQMADDEIDAFLEVNGLGTLAFGGERPYAIPMSYGFDSTERRVYVQFGLFEGSEKRDRVNEGAPVSLVVTDYQRPDRWTSVVVEGELTFISESEARRQGAIELFATSQFASVDVFSRNPDEVDFQWYRIADPTYSGRTSVASR